MYCCHFYCQHSLICVSILHILIICLLFFTYIKILWRSMANQIVECGVNKYLLHCMGGMLLRTSKGMVHKSKICMRIRHKSWKAQVHERKPMRVQSRISRIQKCWNFFMTLKGWSVSLNHTDWAICEVKYRPELRNNIKDLINKIM